MSEEANAYIQDPRTACKYGMKCYQKNPDHHKTFKHPPQLNKNKTKTDNRMKRRFSPYTRDSPTRKKEVPLQLPIDKDTEEILDTTEKKPSTSEDTDISTRFNVLRQDTDKDCVKLPEDLKFYENNIDLKEKIKELFLVDMPEDFFKFYQFLNTADEPIAKTLDSVNLELIGPYDLLLGRLPILENKDLYLIHWRFFFDPPEFQAVLKKKGKSQYHIGYFRDAPDIQPEFLAYNDSAKDCHITPLANNIFGAVFIYLQNEKKTSPFTAIACQKLIDKIKKIAADEFSLKEYNMKKRMYEVKAKTFHRAGIVVPYDKKTQIGYRHLVMTDAQLKEQFTKLRTATSQTEKDQILSEIQPVITYASIAADECDFGTGLEAGIDLFCSGIKDLEPSALSSLCTAYSLLSRPEFSKIIQVHMKYRRKGSDMSLLRLS